MERTPTATIETAQDQLRAIRGQFETFVAEFPELFDGSDETIVHLRAALEESQERLDKPVLRLATFGTTSSGKSTLVNTLIARPVAPMEAGELSAGVLRIIDSDERALSIKDTPGATWDTGRFHGSDEELYKRGEDVLKVYREARHTGASAPEMEAHGPLLPAKWTELLNLPAGIGFQIYDLPGLNHALDQDSLRVLQDQVNDAFGLVVLDYCATDPKTRAVLLNELKVAVDRLGGQTDTLVFALNRVDRRGSYDESIEDRLKSIKTDVRKALNLTDEPVIVPTVALPAFYASILWGPTNPNGESGLANESIQKIFNELLLDGPAKGWFLVQGDEDDDLSQEFRAVWTALKREPADTEHRRWLLKEVWNKTGIVRLWLEIQARVRSKLVSLVLFPAVSQSLTLLDSFCARARETAAIRDIASIAELDRRSSELRALLEAADEELRAQRQKFEERFSTALETLGSESGVVERTNAAYDSLGEHFAPLKDSVRLVQNDIIDSILEPLRTALLNRTPAEQIQADMSNVVGVKLARELTEAVTKYRELAPDPSKETPFRQDLSDDHDGKPHPVLLQVQQVATSLYLAVRHSMSQRASLVLQANAKTFETALQRTTDDLARAIEASVVGSISAAEAIQSVFVASRIAVSSFPKVSFELDFDGKHTQDDRKVKVGSEVIEDPSCWGNKKTRPIYGTQKYQEMRLPSAQQMADDWSKGIDKEQSKLWRIIARWANEQLIRQDERIKYAMTNVRGHFEHQITQRRHELSNQRERQADRTQRTEVMNDNLQAHVHRLRTLVAESD